MFSTCLIVSSEYLLFVDCFYYFFRSFIRKMGVDHKHGVYCSRQPPQNGKYDIQNELYRLSAQKNRHRRQNDRKKIPHIDTPVKLSVKQIICLIISYSRKLPPVLFNNYPLTCR